MKGETKIYRHSSFQKSTFLIIILCLAALSCLFVLAGCKSTGSANDASAYSLDDLKIDAYEARTEIIRGYRGYGGKVIKISPLNGAKWNDYSRAIYWDWEMEGVGYYQIEVSMSILVESPNSGRPTISAYKPSYKSANIPSSIKWKGPGNIGWTVQNEEYYGTFGESAVNVPYGKWVDLNFSQAIDITNTMGGQIFLDGHNDAQGLIDLTIYVRNFKVTMVPTTKFIALTFSEGPSDFTEYLLDRLDKLEMKATFFMVGMGIDAQSPIFDRGLSIEDRASKAQDRRALLKRIHDEGHELGNLLYTHSSGISTPVSEAAIRKELMDNQATIQRAVYGESDDFNYPWVSKYCRIPHNIDASQITNLSKVASELGLPIIGGTRNINNDSSRSPAEIAENIYEQIPDWGIIISLDPRLDPSLLRVVDILLPRLKNEGYLCLTLSEMAVMRDKELVPGKTYDSLDPSLP